MRRSLSIENIQELRNRQGIVDATLGDDIKRLKAGDAVKISLETSGHGFETVTVRVTSFRGGVVRGRLVKSPAAANLRELHAGSLMTFRSVHIHSIVGRSNSASCIDQSASAPTKAEIMRAARMEADAECEQRSASSIPLRRHKISRRRTRRLRVEGTGSQLFILVPIDRSRDLHTFLRINHIRSSPPQPCYSDCDRIELDRRSDSEQIQRMLDEWSARTPATPKPKRAMATV